MLRRGGGGKGRGDQGEGQGEGRGGQRRGGNNFPFKGVSMMLCLLCVLKGGNGLCM